MTTASLVGFVDLRDPDRSIEQQKQPFIEDYHRIEYIEEQANDVYKIM